MPIYEYVCQRCGHEQERYVRHPDQRADQLCEVKGQHPGQDCLGSLGSPKITGGAGFICTGPGTHAFECGSESDKQARVRDALAEAPPGPIPGSKDITRVHEKALGVKRPRRVLERDTAMDGHGTGDN